MQERGEATFNFLKNPKILDVAESMTGSTEIVCNPIQHIRAVLPHRGESKPTHWHQDAGVCWFDIDPYFTIAIWVPIVDATPKNNALSDEGNLKKSDGTLTLPIFQPQSPLDEKVNS